MRYLSAMSVENTRMPFAAHLTLLQAFITQRAPIVDRIQGVLNAQERSTSQLQDRALLSRQFEDCFHSLPAIPRELSALRGQLQQAHWDDGFRPRVMPGIPNEMFDPADMMVRAFNVWRNTRWPGRNGRLRYAQTLFNLHVVRCLALLGMRVCDDGPGASTRLAQMQDVLGNLWRSSPADQPVLVRDVRWLLPVAQSPTTDDLGRYFEAARRFDEGLDETDCLEIHRASVVMAGGHLRSQLRHFTMQGRELGEHSLTLSTRRSNALDCAMTIQHLTPLLAAYDQAIRDGSTDRRRVLAGVICQGISSDPELFAARLDLLAAYSMVEHLFVATAEDGSLALTPTGRRHVELTRQYQARMTALAPRLLEDCPDFRPAPGNYSPYGVMYGFSSNILEHMTLKALQPEAETRFSLEDVFTDEGNGAERLAWVSGWRRLPHVPPEVVKLYEYPQVFAAEIFARIEAALQRRAHDDAGNAAHRTGHLRVEAGGDGPDGIAAQYVHTSGTRLVASGHAQARDEADLIADRLEGTHLLSYSTADGWVAISKDILTDLLGAGQDVQISGLPETATQSARLLYGWSLSP